MEREKYVSVGGPCARDGFGGRWRGRTAVGACWTLYEGAGENFDTVAGKECEFKP